MRRAGSACRAQREEIFPTTIFNRPSMQKCCTTSGNYSAKERVSDAVPCNNTTFHCFEQVLTILYER